MKRSLISKISSTEKITYEYFEIQIILYTRTKLKILQCTESLFDFSCKALSQNIPKGEECDAINNNISLKKKQNCVM